MRQEGRQPVRHVVKYPLDEWSSCPRGLLQPVYKRCLEFFQSEGARCSFTTFYQSSLKAAFVAFPGWDTHGMQSVLSE